jgi:hypothetical protein
MGLLTSSFNIELSSIWKPIVFLRVTEQLEAMVTLDLYSRGTRIQLPRQVVS